MGKFRENFNRVAKNDYQEIYESEATFYNEIGDKSIEYKIMVETVYKDTSGNTSISIYMVMDPYSLSYEVREDAWGNNYGKLNFYDVLDRGIFVLLRTTKFYESDNRLRKNLIEEEYEYIGSNIYSEFANVDKVLDKIGRFEITGWEYLSRYI